MTQQNPTEVINPTGRSFHHHYAPSLYPQMYTIIQNGWDQLRVIILSLFCVRVQHPDFRFLNCVRLTDHYTTSIALSMGHTLWMCYLSTALTATSHLALLYYDYVLTFDRERRLVWSQCNLKQWGTVLFFLNRYCGVIGHVPVIVLKFVRPGSPLYLLCRPLTSYHQILAVTLQTIVGCMSLRSQTYHALAET